MLQVFLDTTVVGKETQVTFPDLVNSQHLAIFELGCHVCGFQETRLTGAGQVWAREVMKREKLEHRLWTAFGSTAFCLGSEARRCCFWCRTGSGVAESTADLST